MTPLEQTIATVKRVVEKTGDAKASRLSGVPYMTVRDARKNDFRKTTTETLEKLFTFAVEYERAVACGERAEGNQGRGAAA